MWVLNLTGPRGYIVIVVLVLMLIAALMFRVDVCESYTQEVLFKVGLGDDEDDFGLAESAAGPLGPGAVAADREGALYLVDTYNDRVIRLGSDGVASEFLTLPAPVLITGMVASEGTLYMLDEGAASPRILTVPVSGAGNTMASVDLQGGATPEDAACYLRGLGITGNSILALWEIVSETELVRQLDLYSLTGDLQAVMSSTSMDHGADKSFSQEAAIDKEVLSIISGTNGFAAESPSDTYFERNLVVCSPQGQVKAEYRVETTDYLRDLSLIGLTSKGDVFLGINLDSPKGQLRRYSPKGSMESSVPWPNDQGVQLLSWGTLDAEDNPLVWRVTPDGLELVRFNRDVSWQIVRR